MARLIVTHSGEVKEYEEGMDYFLIQTDEFSSEEYMKLCESIPEALKEKDFEKIDDLLPLSRSLRHLNRKEDIIRLLTEFPNYAYYYIETDDFDIKKTIIEKTDSAVAFINDEDPKIRQLIARDPKFKFLFLMDSDQHVRETARAE